MKEACPENRAESQPFSRLFPPSWGERCASLGPVRAQGLYSRAAAQTPLGRHGVSAGVGPGGPLLRAVSGEDTGGGAAGGATAALHDGVQVVVEPTGRISLIWFRVTCVLAPGLEEALSVGGGGGGYRVPLSRQGSRGQIPDQLPGHGELASRPFRRHLVDGSRDLQLE